MIYLFSAVVISILLLALRGLLAALRNRPVCQQCGKRDLDVLILSRDGWRCVSGCYTLYEGMPE